MPLGLIHRALTRNALQLHPMAVATPPCSAGAVRLFPSAPLPAIPCRTHRPRRHPGPVWAHPRHRVGNRHHSATRMADLCRPGCSAEGVHPFALGVSPPYPGASGIFSGSGVRLLTAECPPGSHRRAEAIRGRPNPAPLAPASSPKSEAHPCLTLYPTAAPHRHARPQDHCVAA